MTTKAEGSRRGSRIQEIAVTAAVASLVSALVTPWIRRWMDGSGLGLGPSPEPQALPPATAGQADDYDLRFERLLEVPDPFASMAVERRTPAGTGWRANDDGRNDVDDEDDPGL